jgi:hypothetical protein
MSQANTRATNQMPPIHTRLCHIVVFTILSWAHVGCKRNEPRVLGRIVGAHFSSDEKRETKALVRSMITLADYG